MTNLDEYRDEWANNRQMLAQKGSILLLKHERVEFSLKSELQKVWYSNIDVQHLLLNGQENSGQIVRYSDHQSNNRLYYWASE